MILGGGQHASLVNILANRQALKVVGWIDKSTNSKFQASKDFLHLTEESDYLKYADTGVGIIPGIASHKFWTRRNVLLEQFSDISRNNPNIIDSRAIISDDVQLGQGIQFIGTCFIQNFAQIGNWSIINSGSIIEHDSKIGDFVHVAPGVTVCGGVSIGSGSYIGAGSTIVEGVSIGQGVLIGAGSLVLKDVPDGDTQYGAPSKPKGNMHE